VDEGDVVAIREGAPILDLVAAAAEVHGQTPPWLLADHDNLRGTVLRRPRHGDFEGPLDERLIVEHYSR
jgi:ribosomal protein S4